MEQVQNYSSSNMAAIFELQKVEILVAHQENIIVVDS